MNCKIKEINLHVTDFCSGKCPMCYATDEKMLRTHGKLEDLKLIVHNAIANGRVERFVMVGGDPCEYPHLVELLKYIKDEGKKYNVDTKNMVISNTHNYFENGKELDIENISSFVDGLCFTVHGENSKIHDEFNKSSGSYDHVIEKLKKYAKVKGKQQEICIIINLMPQTVHNLEKIINNIYKDLDNQVDSIAIQRIAPIGKACGTTKYFIEKEDVNLALKILKETQQKYGCYLELVDAFPWCIVKPEYRDMLNKGGCNWGNDYCAVFKDGTVSRCAMSENKLSKNIMDLDTPDKFEKFWLDDQELIKFRKKEHLDKICKKCKMLTDCGGACVLARKTGDPYKTKIPEKGNDYLASRNK